MATKTKLIPLRSAPRTTKTKLQPKHVLAEFRENGEHIEVSRLASPCGPFIHGYKNVASWKVVVPDEKMLAFLEIDEEIGNTQRLFHGTRADSVGSITREGLRKGSQTCMFGGGIYFGGPEKAIGYAHTKTYTGEGGRYIFEADVVLGKPYVAPEAERFTLRKLQTMDCNSVHGKRGHTKSWHGALQRDEYVVYSPDQVFLHRLHEYQATQTPWFEYGRTFNLGYCMVLKDSPNRVNERNRAFKDLVAKAPCALTAYNHVDTTSGQKVWLCAKCIEENKLGNGSKIEVQIPHRWSTDPKSGRQTVQIRC